MLSNPVTAAIGGVLSVFLGIRAHHKAAVKNEAAGLNNAVPGVVQAYKGIFSQLNSGQISKSEASAAIDRTVTEYETFVYDTAGIKRKAGNGPDVVETSWIKPWADKLKALISTGSGSANLDIDIDHAGFKQNIHEVITLSPSAGVDPFAWGSSAVAAVEGWSSQKKIAVLLLLAVAAAVLFRWTRGARG